MRCSDAIRQMVRASGFTLGGASVRMQRPASYLQSILARGGTPKASTVAEAALACGWELVLEGPGGERIPIDGFTTPAG